VTWNGQKLILYRAQTNLQGRRSIAEISQPKTDFELSDLEI